MAAKSQATLGGLKFDDVRAIAKLGMPIDQIEMLAEKGFTADEITELAENAKASSGNGGLTKDDMAELMDIQRKASDPNNRRHPGVSVFNPAGDLAHPKTVADGTALDRETYFCGARQNDEMLTPAEIAAFNKIQGWKAIESKGWWAKVSEKRREVYVPCKEVDQRMDLPRSLELILLELADGSAAVDPAKLTQHIQDQETRILELEKKLASAQA